MDGRSRTWVVTGRWISVIVFVFAIYSIINRVILPVSSDVSNIQEIVRVRNDLSTQLNDMRKIIGQMQCEASSKMTNEQGGWCRNASTEDGGQHSTDRHLIPKLSLFLQNKRVASFGDGPGAYKRELSELGHVQTYDAFDGAPFCEETSQGRVKFMDLTIPQFGLPIYDWIISLEVAEHIPENYEAIYLDNIFRHAKEGIIISWAVPGQGGLKHINNKPLSYVTFVMRKHGFEWDEKSTNYLRSAASLPWIKRNTNVFIRKDYAQFKSENNLVQWFL